MRPSRIFDARRSEILAIASRYPVGNVRFFGSVLTGKDGDDSDLDLLVDTLPGASLFDLGGLQDELQTSLGIKVDLLTPQEIPQYFRDKVIAEAQAV